MNIDKLERNIISLVEEQQLKLGYLKETVRFYFPLASLNNFLDTECDADEMLEQMEIFSKTTVDTLGGIAVTNDGNRFCIAVPPQGAEHINKNLDKNSFIATLIETVRNHGCTFEQVIEVFKEHSSMLHIEEMSNDEFDYLVYFEYGVPDCYRYCLSVGDDHVTYHRYTPEDYEDLF